jgi:hypothetical protein
LIGMDRPWQAVAAVAVGMWVMGLTALSQLVTYSVDQFTIVTSGRSAPGGTLVLVALVAAVLAVVPAALLGWLATAPRVRAAGQAWTWAGLAFAALSAARLVPAEQHELYLGGLGAACVLLARLLHRRGEQFDATARRLAGLAGGLVMLLPWAWVGALGGAIETVLAVAAAAAAGWLAAVLLRRVDPGNVFVDGLVAIVALTPIAAGLGWTGVSLAELVVLPPLGIAAAALRRGSGLLFGVAAAGPLAFIDPEETAIILGTSDVGWWTLVASGAALAIALGLDVAYALARRAWRRPVAAALVLVAAIAVTAVYFGAGQPGLHGEHLFVVMKEQADLGGISGGREDRLRATYRRLVDTAERTQAGLRKDLRGLRLRFRPYYLVNAVEVDAGPAIRAWLARRSDVDRVLLNPVLRPLPAPQRPISGAEPAPAAPTWGLELLGAPRVWSDFDARGAGIVIGISDSGVDGAHPAVAGAFRGGDDSWYDPWNGTRTPTDRNGHGTHALGSALGAGGIGVAPDAKWVGCVNLDRNLGNPARYLDCLQFMLAPFPHGGDPFRDGRPERAPHVLTNSWGCPPAEGCDGRVLGPAVSALTAAGIFFVAAAGNTGPRCGSIDDEPALYEQAFTVAAVDKNRQPADFSSRGPVPGAAEPDVAAPGVDVLSAVPGGGYARLDGTSMAAPHVAGVVALLWSSNPSLVADVRRTAEVLLSSTTEVVLAPGASQCGGARNLVGAGVVNAYAAVRSAG